MGAALTDGPPCEGKCSAHEGKCFYNSDHSEPCRCEAEVKTFFMSMGGGGVPGRAGTGENYGRSKRR